MGWLIFAWMSERAPRARPVVSDPSWQTSAWPTGGNGRVRVDVFLREVAGIRKTSVGRIFGALVYVLLSS
jgi:hypothetical protein